MPDYKQTEIVGSVHHRFSRVVVNNPIDRAPDILCVEQRVITLEDGKDVKDIGNLNFPFVADKVYPLRNPVTGELLGGTITAAEVQVALYSAVMAEAYERDELAAAATTTPAPVPEEE